MTETVLLPPPPPGGAAVPAAIVVLGARLSGPRVAGGLQRRCERGAQVWGEARSRRSEVVLVCTGGQGEDEPRTEASAMAEFLVELGVPAQALLLEQRATSTVENLANTAALLQLEQVGCSPSSPGRDWMLVVTSDYHVPRTRLFVRALGLQARVVGSGANAWPLPALLREVAAVPFGLADVLRRRLLARRRERA